MFWEARMSFVYSLTPYSRAAQRAEGPRGLRQFFILACSAAGKVHFPPCAALTFAPLQGTAGSAHPPCTQHHCRAQQAALSHSLPCTAMIPGAITAHPQHSCTAGPTEAPTVAAGSRTHSCAHTHLYVLLRAPLTHMYSCGLHSLLCTPVGSTHSYILPRAPLTHVLLALLRAPRVHGANVNLGRALPDDGLRQVHPVLQPQGAQASSVPTSAGDHQLLTPKPLAFWLPVTAPTLSPPPTFPPILNWQRHAGACLKGLVPHKDVAVHGEAELALVEQAGVGFEVLGIWGKRGGAHVLGHVREHERLCVRVCVCSYAEGGMTVDGIRGQDCITTTLDCGVTTHHGQRRKNMCTCAQICTCVLAQTKC